jgi:hypothetical protein
VRVAVGALHTEPKGLPVSMKFINISQNSIRNQIWENFQKPNEIMINESIYCSVSSVKCGE